MAFVNRKHRPESNAKRSKAMKELYATAPPAGMGFKPKYTTEEERKRAQYGSHIKRRYGITLEEYDQMFERQHGLCEICQRDKKLVVDHDHSTGKVRGLLCQPCNIMLGIARDSGDTLHMALAYISGVRRGLRR